MFSAIYCPKIYNLLPDVNILPLKHPDSTGYTKMFFDKKTVNMVSFRSVTIIQELSESAEGCKNEK